MTGASASQTGLSQAEPEVSALRASIPSADETQERAPMPRGQPIYVAVVLARQWAGERSLTTTWTMAYANYREAALGAAVDSCRKKNPDFEISTTDVIEIRRERRSASDLFWTGAMAGFVFALLLLWAVASAIEARSDATPKSRAAAEGESATAESGDARNVSVTIRDEGIDG